MKKVKINISNERYCTGLTSIGNIVSPIVKDMFTAEDLLFADLYSNWSEIVGLELSSYSTPKKIKFKIRENLHILFIDVPLGGFALELKHREEYLLSKINSYFGYNVIHELKINQNINCLLNKNTTIKNAKKDVRLEESDENYILNLANGIKDEKLKKILIKLGQNVVIANKKEG